VVGGTERAASTGLSAVLLNRGGPYSRRGLFQALEKAGFDYIVSMEGKREHYDLEDLSGRFPFVRFILTKENLSPGEEINLAASELLSPLFFVLWNDYRLFNGINAQRISRLFLRNGASRICTVPVIQNSRFEVLHTLTSPLYYRNTVKALPGLPEKENQPSLFPHDWVGIYGREAFLRIGGFDREIKTGHWQLMDFGFRAHLWGERIHSTQLVRMVYDGGAPPADSTADGSYRLFYLKNLAPVFRDDHGHLPLRRFPSCLAKTGWDLLTAWEEFFHERRWVKENRSRFRSDARTITDLWESAAGADENGGPDY
jgi:GT2 family glycosyltransferase